MPQLVLPDLDAASVESAVGIASFVQGMRFLRQRAVADVEWDARQCALHGTVRDPVGKLHTATAYLSEADSPQLSFDRGQCSCDARVNCQHAAALALTAVVKREARTTPAAPPAPALPAPALPAPALPAPALPAPALPAPALPAPPLPAPPLPAPALPAPALSAPALPALAGPPALASGVTASAAAGTAAWARSFDKLLDTQPQGAAAVASTTPLAIEVSLAADPVHSRSPATSPAPPRLLARLMQAGKNGGWIAGNLAWSKLDSLRYLGNFRAAQVELLHELLALYRSRSGRSHYSYSSYVHGYGVDKTIDLAAFESRHLWPLLDQAEAVGLKLVYPRKLGSLERHCHAEFSLDVTSDTAGALTITPALQVSGTVADVTLIRFLGAEGHGVVYAERAETQRSLQPADWRFRLAALAKPVPRQLQDMALAAHRLAVPADGRDRFLADYFPRLRQSASVISSDGSFSPPEVLGPTLVLHAAYSEDHHVEAEWRWAYQVGGEQLTAALDCPPQTGPAAAYRDIDAERLVLAGLDLRPDRFGLLRATTEPAGNGPVLAPRVKFSGVDTMRFTTELLPLLAGQPGVAVAATGTAADYRDESESLQIGLSADAVAGDPDWFDLGVSITVAGRQVPFAAVFVALSQGESHLLLPDGTYFSLATPELTALARLIEEARALQDAPGGPLRISRFQASLWDELAALGVVNRQAREWQDQVQGLLSIDTVDQTEPPAGLQGQLRPYQLDGYRWLTFLWQHRLGGILADDMGLGKTLQSLALISHARHAEPDSAPFLIVAPTSVVSNWAAEAARFTPGLRVVPVTDTTARRGRDLGALTAGADVVVTSYTLLRIDFDAYSKLDWSAMILDEAQYAKNYQSKIYQCARRLRAPVKLAITGTPIENNLMELWSLLSISAPGLFPNPARFRDYYARPIEQRRDPDRLAQLQRRVRPLMRRRTKEQVAADLPAKQEQVLEVELHPRHRKLYQTYLQRERQKVLGLIGDMNANRFTIFRSLTLLRQLSLHAGLVDLDNRQLSSGKIDMLLEQLSDVVGGGHRALVFSQFTGFLALVRERLDGAGLKYCYLDGSTKDRSAVIRQFKNGTAPVFLISLKAGGFGLNLTEADYCFLLDPWWNPATEAQAVDRTHRIGQTRKVMVYRLIAKDTIEEKVMALKARKGELFSSVLDGGGAFSTGIDADDIRALLA